VADKVLSRGDSIAAPAGRADDFSWPRPGNDANAAPDIPPQPVALTPAAPGKKASDKKSADVKADAKGKPAANPVLPKPIKPQAGGF
jgi:hypothetical protein